MRRVGRLWQKATGCGPVVIGSERQSEPFVGYPKIAVATDSDRVGSYGSDLLRNHPDIGLLAAVVSEAVVTKAVVEPAQQHDIVLQLDVRATPATATAATTAEATATTAAEATTAAAAKAPAAPDCCSTVSAAGREPRPAAMTHA
jgi:hypothetical protein